jgi:hypothetical protein
VALVADGSTFYGIFLVHIYEMLVGFLFVAVEELAEMFEGIVYGDNVVNL